MNSEKSDKLWPFWALFYKLKKVAYIPDHLGHCLDLVRRRNDGFPKVYGGKGPFYMPSFGRP